MDFKLTYATVFDPPAGNCVGVITWRSISASSHRRSWNDCQFNERRSRT